MISKTLTDNRIVKVTKVEDDRFRVMEMCDEYFACYLTAAQLVAWADELRAMTDAPNATIIAVDAQIKAQSGEEDAT